MDFIIKGVYMGKIFLYFWLYWLHTYYTSHVLHLELYIIMTYFSRNLISFLIFSKISYTETLLICAMDFTHLHPSLFSLGEWDMIWGEIASTLINWMGGFRIRDVEVNGDFAFADRMEVSVNHICTLTIWHQTSWVIDLIMNIHIKCPIC